MAGSFLWGLQVSSWQEMSGTGRFLIMLETGNNFLFLAAFSSTSPAPSLYQSCRWSPRMRCWAYSPEGHVPSCHTGLPQSSFCVPHGLELAPHLFLSACRIVHVGQRLTLFTGDTRAHQVHLSCLMVLPIHLVLRSLSQIKQIICLLFFSSAHKGCLIWPAKAGLCQH